MSGLFKTKTPKVEPAPAPDPIPERTAEETTELAATQRNRVFSNQGGRALTMLTGGTGTAGGSMVSRYLGGAART